MVLIVLAVICCVLLQSELTKQSEQSLVNEVADFILKSLKIFNPSSFPMNNMTRGYAQGSTVIETNLGVVSDFKTIQRVGDFKINLNGGDRLVVNARIKFDDLTVRFEEYKLIMLGMVASSGIVEAIVKDNLIEIEVDIGQKPLCFIAINKMDILTLDDIDLRFYQSDEQEVHWKSKISNQLMKMFKETIKDEAQNILREELPTLIKPNEHTLNAVTCVQGYAATCVGTVSYRCAIND